MADRTEIELAMKETVSETLHAVADALDVVIAKSRQLGETGTGALERFNAPGGRAAARIKNTNRELAGFTSTLAAFTKGVLAPLGTVAGLEALSSSVLKLAESRVQLHLFADTARISATNIVGFTRGMENLGVSSDQAKQYIGNL